MYKIRTDSQTDEQMELSQHIFIYLFNNSTDPLIKSKDDAIALLMGHQTCDLQVAGLTLGWVPLRSGFGQATYVPVCLRHQAV